MNTGMFPCACALLLCAACGDGPAAEGDAPLPVHLHALSGLPGCYVPQTAEPAGESTSMADQMRQFQEMNQSFNMQYIALIAHTILDDPHDDRWQLITTRGELTTVMEIRALVKEERFTELVLETYTEGWVQVSISEKQWISRSGTSYAHADERSTRFDFGPAWYRWSDFTVVSTEPAQVPQLDGDGTPTYVAATVTTVRGCDPSRGISFGQGYDQPFHCWQNDTGAEVSCDGVELWP